MSAPPRAAPCPYCGANMQSGTAEIRGTFLGFLFYGFSRQHLWFWKGGKERKKRILESCTESSALQCVSCGAVALPAEKSLRERVEGAARQISTFVEERSRAKR